ncbi:DUF2490 domain-containing protein [Chitinophaga pinensis]|uniref:DUF2490 domain-containing protein n=1 Tax=Chitinophaga pinensis (strain ATCC 43595 / DSM 2588 / LMG 13176 / NBRC 15968 / NCIMB 11800 / UQM 2034) TaxID=485918 RepID=A0A979GQT0_CHIPD|nr:DUF2490 domain-containing protein [Chitinophaga pinensis]ACU61807.1 hypothetical protein Cpin_4360 [Chitinophaga pinensis DSM 2588]
MRNYPTVTTQILYPKYLLKAYLLLFLTLYSSICIYSQQQPTTTAWVIPGITYQHAERLKLSAQYALSTHQHTHLLYLQSYIGISKYVILNPAYLYINYHPPAGPVIPEHSFMTGCLLTTKLNRIILEDRNVIWNRFRQHAADMHIYRNRLRLTWPLPGKLQQTRIYSFDETWILINEKRWMRNRIAAGVSSDVLPWFNLDMSYAYEQDKVNGGLNIFFIMGTIQLSRKQR